MKLKIKHAGFTLLEVAISMGVLAIGLLGLVSLQAVSLKNSSSVLYRSQATNLAHSIIDAMRVNKSALGSYVTAMEPAPECKLLDLNGNIAENDLMAWKNTLACTLPQGTGSIAVNGNFVTVTVRWDDSRNQTQAEQEHSDEKDLLTTIKVIIML